MPDPKRPLKVFLCHAHADRDPVRGLYVRLTKDGVDAWLDKAKLLPGQDWELEIRKAVREADVVVVCLSKQFNQAGFRQKEVRWALDTAMEQPEGEIFIIPARLEECDTLESLRKWHWVDLFEDDGYDKLMRALRARTDIIGATLKIKNSGLQIEETREKPETKKEIQRLGTFRKNIISIGGFIIVVLLAMFALNPLNNKNGTFNSTQVPTATPTSLPIGIADEKGVEMMEIPSGEFIMGSNNIFDPILLWGAEDLRHLIYLNTFFIDRTEVTNSMYRMCQSANVCRPLEDISSSTHNDYYANSEFDNFPVINVTYEDASVFCGWRKARLPTEAEWEKAARGTDGRLFPWGDDDPTLDLANFCQSDCLSTNTIPMGDTALVGSYPLGASPYGVLDMSGNVWEWVSDWFSTDYYANSPYQNPLGPEIGSRRTIRGGSWWNDIDGLRTPARASKNPDSKSNTIGFRCARDANP